MSSRGYGKWEKPEEKLLVQLWCEHHTTYWRVKMHRKYGKNLLRLSAKVEGLQDHNRNQTGGGVTGKLHRSTMNSIDSILGC